MSVGNTFEESSAAAPSTDPIGRLLSRKAVFLALICSAVAIMIMQAAILANTDLEELLRAKLAADGLSQVRIDANVAKQMEQAKYAPLMILVSWPVFVCLGAAIFAAMLRLLAGRGKPEIWSMWRAFAVSISLSYTLYAAVCTVLAVTAGNVAPQLGLDAFAGKDQSAWVKSALQTFDIANLAVIAFSVYLVPRAVKVAPMCVLLNALLLMVVYAGLKGGLVFMTMSKEEEVICELCELTDAQGNAPPAR